MDDSSDDDLEIGPQKSAEELLRERERLAEANGDVVDVGADDADAAMPPPVAVKPEKVKPERKPHLAYEDEAMEAPPVDEEEPEHAPEPWWKKLQGKKRPSKAPEALAAELKELSIAAAARAPPPRWTAPSARPRGPRAPWTAASCPAASSTTARARAPAPPHRRGALPWPRPRRRGGACAPASPFQASPRPAAASRRRRRPRRRRRRRRSPRRGARAPGGAPRRTSAGRSRGRRRWSRPLVVAPGGWMLQVGRLARTRGAQACRFTSGAVTARTQRGANAAANALGFSTSIRANYLGQNYPALVLACQKTL